MNNHQHYTKGQDHFFEAGRHITLTIRLSLNAAFLLTFAIILTIQTCNDRNKVTKKVNRLKKIMALAMIIYNIIHIIYLLVDWKVEKKTVYKGVLSMVDYSNWGICIYIFILYMF